MNDTANYRPFSERNGLQTTPPQLKLGEVSNTLRRLLDYAIAKEIERVEEFGIDYCYFAKPWLEVATDWHVKFCQKPVSSFNNKSYTVRKELEAQIGRLNLGLLFDLIEFFARHPLCSSQLKSDLASAFIEARAAYRLIDGLVIAIGTEQQAAAFEAAIADAEAFGAQASQRHLLQAGLALKDGSWADSVRESIHAVEAMGRKINPKAATLGPALKILENDGYIHGSLKAAFDKLYGYTSDEDGIRHALSAAEARVDEVDALFMLGACASFVSYLIAREAALPKNRKE